MVQVVYTGQGHERSTFGIKIGHLRLPACGSGTVYSAT